MLLLKILRVKCPKIIYCRLIITLQYSSANNSVGAIKDYGLTYSWRPSWVFKRYTKTITDLFNMANITFRIATYTSHNDTYIF